MEGHDHGHGHSHGERHEHHGLTSRGTFDDIAVLRMIGVTKGQRFLDAGCADGHFSIAASNLVGETGHVFSFDIHEPSLNSFTEEVSSLGISNITIGLVDVRGELPVEDATLDHFFLSNVMHGFVFNGEEAAVISNIRSKLKIGGLLSLIEWDKDNVVHGPPRDHRLSFEEMKALVSHEGFSPVKKGMASPEHVLMMFKRI
ncbi:MAG: class I SAM-dependent methyltransferase [Thermoplasmatota archaeon]